MITKIKQSNEKITLNRPKYRSYLATTMLVSSSLLGVSDPAWAVPMIIDTVNLTINGSANSFNGVPFSTRYIDGGNVAQFLFRSDLNIAPGTRVTASGPYGVSLYSANNAQIGAGTTFNISAENPPLGDDPGPGGGSGGWFGSAWSGGAGGRGGRGGVGGGVNPGWEGYGGETGIPGDFGRAGHAGESGANGGNGINNPNGGGQGGVGGAGVDHWILFPQHCKDPMPWGSDGAFCGGAGGWGGRTAFRGCIKT